MKNCTKCGEAKPKTEFGKDVQKRDGLRCCCKTCNRASRAKWYAANTEKAKAYDAKLYTDNPEKKKAVSAKWRADNPEKLKAYSAKYSASNSEIRRIHCHNYRARKRTNGGKLSRRLAERLYKFQRGKCACCGQPLGDDYHLDHIMPLALGGSNTDDNIQLLRQQCNNQKRAKHPIDFMQSRGFLL